MLISKVKIPFFAVSVSRAVHIFVSLAFEHSISKHCNATVGGGPSGNIGRIPLMVFPNVLNSK